MSVHPISATTNRPRPRTILLVEDEPFVREATCSLLENAGFAVLTAEDAGCAMTAFEESKNRIDLLMTDMILPGRSGLQLGQDLRQLCPELRVLVTSGYTNAEYDVEKPATQTYFLSKPYSRRELIGKVEAALEIAPVHQTTSQAG